jgi:hypothetical protein
MDKMSPNLVEIRNTDSIIPTYHRENNLKEAMHGHITTHWPKAQREQVSLKQRGVTQCITEKEQRLQIRHWEKCHYNAPRKELSAHSFLFSLNTLQI